MFAQKNRLTKDLDFKNVFDNGRSSFDYILGVKAVDNNLPFYRVGILVGTKVDKKAIARNLIKRRIRGVVKKILTGQKINKDIVIISQPAILKSDFSSIENSILKHFKKLRII